MTTASTLRRSRWISSIWLVYLVFVFVDPYLSRAPPWIWVVSVLTVIVFLPVYFAAFELASSRPRRAIAMAVAMAVVGLAMMPLNIGMSTFVTYAAAAAGFVFHRRRDSLLFIVAISAALFAATVAAHPPFAYWMPFQPLITLLVGVGNIVAAEERRRSASVRRAQEDVEEMAKLAERERIARDLHDVLGHTLSVIALKSELASKLSTIDPERAFQEIREVERVARHALTEVRSAVEGYRGHGLRGELQSAAEALGAAGVRLDTDVAAVPLPPKQETVLALAVREAITNIVRHARATMCRISLTQQDGRVVLRIEDDGVGGLPREGNGLTGMRERVAAIGGRLDIGSAPGTGRSGFMLTVTV
jgi:two-component system, NarL family, sensor histidine kinase DesK